MHFNQYLKNKKKAIEEYLETPNDPIKRHKLFKQRKQDFIHGDNRHKYSKLIRKELQSTTDHLNKMSQPIVNHQTFSCGLYHDRNNDFYDWNHIDCVEDGFCLHHNRAYDKNNNYKYHYHCRYGMCSHSFMKTGMIHGEKKWFSSKFVCFGCRNVTTRSSNLKCIRSYSCIKNWPKCSQCQKHMTSVSVAFQPPPKKDTKHWEKLDKEWYDDSRITYDEYIKYA